jgi:hypothetical protein
MDAYRELMQRKAGPASEAYRKFLEEGYPNERDYQPTKTTRLAAILSGAAAGFQNPGEGYKTADAIISKPYEDRLRQYNSEGGRLKEAAALEEAQHRNDITSVQDIMSQQYKQQELERQNKLADSTIALNAARAKTAGQTVVHADDGHVYIFAGDGTKKDLGKLSQTPDEKVQNAIKQAVGEEKGKSPIIEGREGRIATLKNSQETARQQGLATFNYDLWNQKESTRQGNRIALTDEKARLAAEKLASQAKTSKVDDIRQIKINANDADAMYDQAGGKDGVFGKYWDPTTHEMKNQDPSDPNFMALWATIYKKTSTGSKGVTKAGNTHVESKK